MNPKESWIGVIAVLAMILCSKAGPLSISEATQEDGGAVSVALTPDTSSIESTTTLDGSYVRQWWVHRIRGDDGGNGRHGWPKFKFSWSLVLGTLIGMFGSALGSVGGVGGGGFYLPMLNVVLGFDAKTSAALSKAMVMGASISSVMFNLKEKHPTDARTVIDYEISMLFQPMILLGISIGVILNVVLPEWLVTLFLIVLFSRLSWTAFKRATCMANLESKQEKDKLRSLANSAGNSEESDNGDYLQISSDSGAPCDPPEAMHETVSWQWFPCRKITVLTCTWLVFLAVQIFKVFVPDCSLWYWLATILQVPVAFGVTIREAFQKDKGEPDSLDREESHAASEETEIERSGLRKFIFSLLGLAAGVVGGLLGIGGGGILGPGFLELGLSPQVSSATASFIMVFSSSLSVAEFALLGRIPVDFAIYLTLIAMMAAIWGQAVIKKIVHSYGKGSIIVFTLVGCILTSAITLGVIGVEKSINQWESGANMGFQEMCAPN